MNRKVVPRSCLLLGIPTPCDGVQGQLQGAEAEYAAMVADMEDVYSHEAAAVPEPAAQPTPAEQLLQEKVGCNPPPHSEIL